MLPKRCAEIRGVARGISPFLRKMMFARRHHALLSPHFFDRMRQRLTEEVRRFTQLFEFAATPSIGRELAVGANQVLNFTSRRRTLAFAFLSAQKEQKERFRNRGVVLLAVAVSRSDRNLAPPMVKQHPQARLVCMYECSSP